VVVIVRISFPEIKKPAWAVAGGLLLISLLLALVEAGRVRRHVRHMVMVKMTMMYANLHPVEKV